MSGAEEGRHPMQGARHDAAHSDAQQKTERQKVARYRNTEPNATATVVLLLSKKGRYCILRGHYSVDCRLRLKCDDTGAEIKISSFAKWNSPFKSARGRQISRLLAAEVCASSVVMVDTPCCEVV